MLRGPLVPISMLRWRARAPRIALVACCAVLSLAGLRTILGGARGVPASPVQSKVVDGSLDGFAEGFARAYVASSAGDTATRDNDLKAYGFGEATSAPARRPKAMHRARQIGASSHVAAPVNLRVWLMKTVIRASRNRFWPVRKWLRDASPISQLRGNGGLRAGEGAGPASRKKRYRG